MEIKSLLDEKFTGPYTILDTKQDPDSDYQQYKYLVMIAHNDIQKDIWITDNGIESVINVPFDHMGRDEQLRWMKYLSKQNA